MLSLLIAAVLANSPGEAARPAVAPEPVRASVRIIRAAEIRVERLAATEESVLRRTWVRERDGTVRTASLVEFY